MNTLVFVLKIFLAIADSAIVGVLLYAALTYLAKNKGKDKDKDNEEEKGE